MLSDLSQLREVFGTQATYCRPADVESLEAAIRSALSREDAKAVPIAWSWIGWPKR